MATYYVEATGSNIYPYNSRATAAISLYELFHALEGYSIYQLNSADIVYINGLVYEPDQNMWYTFNGASLIGADSLVDRIYLGNNTIYGTLNGITIRNISFSTDNTDSYFIWCDGNFDISRCRFNGNNIIQHAIYHDSRSTNVSLLCNTFENFTGNAIYLKDTGPTDRFVGTSQTTRNWKQMTVDPSNNIYVAMATYEYIYKRNSGGSTFNQLAITRRNWNGAIAAAPNGDIYACTSTGVYKQTNGIGDFNEVQATVNSNISITGIAVAANNDVYITNGSVQLPEGSRSYGVWKQIAGTGVFVSLNIVDKYWSGITIAPNGAIYACVRNGDIYISEDDGTTFTPLNQTPRKWTQINVTPNGDILAIVQSGGVYIQYQGVGDYVAIDTYPRNYFGVCQDYNGDIYAAVTGEDIMEFTPGGESITFEGSVIANSFNNVASATIQYTYLNFEKFYFLNNAFQFTSGPSNLYVDFNRSTITDFQNSNNILESPQFLGNEPDPLLIDELSPCYHTGIEANVDFDILGNPYFNPPSIGAYEVTSSTYVVSYEGNGNTGGTVPIDLNEYTTGDMFLILEPGTLVKEDAVFYSWNTNIEGTGIDFFPGSYYRIGESNVMFYAKWVNITIGGLVATIN